jgi:hypothetical protein
MGSAFVARVLAGAPEAVVLQLSAEMEPLIAQDLALSEVQPA